MYVSAEPAILYLGTPVVLVSSLNEDGSANLAPISSAFWLGWRCVIGMGSSAKTVENLVRERECVLNLPDDTQVTAVDRLAKTTGCEIVPERKRARGYVYEKDKFKCSGLAPMASDIVRAPRAHPCPVQLEARLENTHALAQDDVAMSGAVLLFELRIVRVHVAQRILRPDEFNHIDPELWRPIIMSFQKYFGLGAGQLQPSRLAEIPESLYRSPDIDRARRECRSRVVA